MVRIRMGRPMGTLVALVAVLLLIGLGLIPLIGTGTWLLGGDDPADAEGGPRPYCGAPVLLKVTGGFHTCTFADDFDGDTLDRAKWSPLVARVSGYHSGRECAVDRPGNIRVAGGRLHLTVRKEAAPFTCHTSTGDYRARYTSGSVDTWHSFAQAYGRFEIRARFPRAKGSDLHSALWLAPLRSVYGPWPTSGEIDLAEHFGEDPARVIPFLRYVPERPDSRTTSTRCVIEDVSAFHTYTVDWTPGRIAISYDGRTCLVNDAWLPAEPLTSPAPFDQPFAIMLTQALGMGPDPGPESMDPESMNPGSSATTEVDYVRVWS